jgi:hypothetical protein
MKRRQSKKQNRDMYLNKAIEIPAATDKGVEKVKHI